MIQSPSKIRTHLQERSPEMLRLAPQERWRCDIFLTNNSDHHGIGKTEAEAIMNAALSYLEWTDKTVPQLVDDTFPAMSFQSEHDPRIIWNTDSSDAAYKSGYESGKEMAAKGQIYQAGGPFIYREDKGSKQSLNWWRYCIQTVLVNAEWLRGWKDGQAQSEVDHQVGGD